MLFGSFLKSDFNLPNQRWYRIEVLTEVLDHFLIYGYNSLEPLYPRPTPDNHVIFFKFYLFQISQNKV